jgi:hypothetical protein
MQILITVQYMRITPQYFYQWNNRGDMDKKTCTGRKEKKYGPPMARTDQNIKRQNQYDGPCPSDENIRITVHPQK